MARVKEAVMIIEELLEQAYSAAYIAGYTGYPVEWVEGFIEGKREMEALYNEGS